MNLGCSSCLHSSEEDIVGWIWLNNIKFKTLWLDFWHTLLQWITVGDRLQDLGWRSLSQRRVDQRLCMVYKIVNGLVAIPIGQYIKLQRNGVHLQNIAAKPKYYEYSFFPRTVSDWNSLPRDFLQAKSLAIFKTRIATLTHVLPY